MNNHDLLELLQWTAIVYLMLFEVQVRQAIKDATKWVKDRGKDEG